MVNESEIRKLRYRLNRQGMLELDAWLSPLERVLSDIDEGTLAQVKELIAADTPALLAMMHGESDLPELLRPWLERK